MLQIIFLVMAVLLAVGLVTAVLREGALADPNDTNGDHNGHGHETPLSPDGEDQTEDIGKPVQHPVSAAPPADTEPGSGPTD
jgi:hypothetical protein